MQIINEKLPAGHNPAVNPVMARSALAVEDTPTGAADSSADFRDKKLNDKKNCRPSAAEESAAP